MRLCTCVCAYYVIVFVCLCVYDVIVCVCVCVFFGCMRVCVRTYYGFVCMRELVGGGGGLVGRVTLTLTEVQQCVVNLLVVRYMRAQP